MPDAVRTLILCAALAAAVPSPAAAQSAVPATQPAKLEFLSRYDFHLWAVWLIPDDEQFTWDAHYGADVDLVDYRFGRLSGFVDYQAVLGTEHRPFDPNQSYYVLEASASGRVRPYEVALFFHHVSRHLSDRQNDQAIAWNIVGLRVMRPFTFRDATIDARLDTGSVINHAWVDYRWRTAFDVVARRPVSPRLGVFARTTGEIILVDELSPRGTQRGGRIEGGVRLAGTRGILELFGGYEQRLDANPFDFQSRRWGFAGFRFLGGK